MCGYHRYSDFWTSHSGEGNCTLKPKICKLDYTPVCGCDGVTYGNACGATAAGASIAFEGECGACSQACSDCENKDTSVFCRKVIVVLEAKEIVHWNSKYALQTILWCVVVMGFLPTALFIPKRRLWGWRQRKLYFKTPKMHQGVFSGVWLWQTSYLWQWLDGKISRGFYWF
jgi:Kazal-type serine protease inhibitor domain